MLQWQHLENGNSTVMIFKQEPSTPPTLEPLIASAGTIDRGEMNHSL